jgi:hypothetical protein
MRSTGFRLKANIEKTQKKPEVYKKPSRHELYLKQKPSL